MAQFPINDEQGIRDGLNYVLSGPSGLGQNFQGASFPGLDQYDLTGSYRPPFAIKNSNDPGVPSIRIYVEPIVLGVSEMLDTRTWKFYFDVPQLEIPFGLGQPVTITGVADDYYDGTYTPIGVVECTYDYVILRTQGEYPVVAPSTGGTASLDSMEVWISTDCNAKVTVNGGGDRVVISSQILNRNWIEADGAGSVYYNVYINRYVGYTAFDPVNPDFRFEFDETIAYKSQLIPTDPGLEPYFDSEVIFTSIIDNPAPGYYWYILEVEYIDNAGNTRVVSSVMNQRSFSAQVVKE